jgi:hypothetical protein
MLANVAKFKFDFDSALYVHLFLIFSSRNLKWTFAGRSSNLNIGEFEIEFKPKAK